jgi:hypothetical protein
MKTNFERLWLELIEDCWHDRDCRCLADDLHDWLSRKGRLDLWKPLWSKPAPADQPADALDPIIHAQHEDTGRTWMGPRSKLPRRYFEVCTDERYSEQGAADKPFV